LVVAGSMVLPVICMSAIGTMVTVSEAVLLAEFGSPSCVLVTVAVLVKAPSVIPRLTVIGTVTVSPCASTPPVWLQVMVAPLRLQLKVAVLPALTTGTTGSNCVALAPLEMKAGTVSTMRTPVAFSGVPEALVTTRV
jgi:hypothetical protein